jgi:hypothetical protein
MKTAGKRAVFLPWTVTVGRTRGWRAMPAPGRRHSRYVAAAVIAVVAWWLAAVFVLRQPSHDRDWEFGFERLPSITIDDGVLSIRNLRDYRLGEDGVVRPGFVNRTLALDDIERAWFLVEPFPALPIQGYKGIAHTYFAFDVRGQPPITVSIEARRERGEAFNVASGLLNEFELMYIWATEEDTTIKRVLDQGNDVYMFPLLMPRESVIRLVERLAATTADLERQPRFYNSFTSNCTSELAVAANRVRPGAIPVSIAWWLPGYSVDQLYELGYIPHDRPLEEVRSRHYISDIVREIHADPAFSARLRASLADEPAAPDARNRRRETPELAGIAPLPSAGSGRPGGHERLSGPVATAQALSELAHRGELRGEPIPGRRVQTLRRHVGLPDVQAKLIDALVRQHAFEGREQRPSVPLMPDRPRDGHLAEKGVG